MRRPRLSTKIYRTSVFPSTQASIRILVEPVLEGPMQVKFRVEVWRCHLSLEQSSLSKAQSPGNPGFPAYFGYHETFTPS